MKKDYGGSSLALTDLTSNLLAIFICLFCLAFLLMAKKIEKAKKVDAKAEFLITVTWPEDSDNDIDTYVEDPLGNLVFFRSREKGLLHLDRDDLGTKNDRLQLPDGTSYEVKENREIVTLRGIIPGEYTVNVHMYMKKDKSEETKVTVKLEKINPSVKLITIKDVIVKENGDEKTAFRFELDKEGQVTKVNDLEKELAKGNQTVAPPGYSPPQTTDSDGDRFDDNTGEYLGSGTTR